MCQLCAVIVGSVQKRGGKFGMRKGYKTTWAVLEEEYRFERDRMEELKSMAEDTSDPLLKQILSEGSQRSESNVQKIAHLMDCLVSQGYEIKMKCPVCGWEINLGADPDEGKEVHCRTCGFWFRLKEEDGDFSLQNIGRR